MQNELLREFGAEKVNRNRNTRNSWQMSEECQEILKDLFDGTGKFIVSSQSNTMESMEEIIENNTSTENVYDQDDYFNDNNLEPSWNSSSYTNSSSDPNSSSNPNNNPWLVNSLEEFTKLYYCCPECDVIESSKEKFVKHALDCHPKAKACLGNLIIKEEQKYVDEDYYEIPEPECEIKQEYDPLVEQFDDDKSSVHAGINSINLVDAHIKNFVKLQHQF